MFDIRHHLLELTFGYGVLSRVPRVAYAWDTWLRAVADSVHFLMVFLDCYRSLKRLVMMFAMLGATLDDAR
jgi:hypothetical protein